MTVENNGGNTEGNQTNNETAPVGGADSTGGESGGNYSKDFVDKIKGEKDNYKSKAQKLETELAKLKAQQTADEEKRLKESEDWKALYQKRDEDFKNLEAKLDGYQKKEVDSGKAKRLSEELTKLGIDGAYLEKAQNLADLNKIKIDNETGAVYGADVVAQNLKQEWPALFKGSANPENVTHGAPERQTNQTPLTLEEWKKLPYNERVKREGELLANVRK